MNETNNNASVLWCYDDVGDAEFSVRFSTRRGASLLTWIDCDVWARQIFAEDAGGHVATASSTIRRSRGCFCANFVAIHTWWGVFTIIGVDFVDSSTTVS